MLPLLLPLAFATEVIVDDEAGAPTFTTTTSNWDTWGIGTDGYDAGDTSYHYLTQYEGDGSRTGTATWAPDLPEAGTWRVEAWFRRTENRTADADHYVTDRHGARHHVSLDQSGDGASGWVSLGEYACAAGAGGCSVLLDGDDGASDEANAMRFTLVAADGGSDTSPCDDPPAAGAHTWEFAAGSVSGSGWDDASAAAGGSDGVEAHSENVDAGEYLRASGWGECDPPGEETLTGVRLAVRARTQYDSGAYEVVLALTDGSSRTTFNGTSSAWHELDLSDRTWTWETLAALTATVELEEHPEGNRDSDAWVDAFRLSVDFTAVGAADTGGGDSGGAADTGDSGTTDPGDTAGSGSTDTGSTDTSSTDSGNSRPADTGRDDPASLPGTARAVDGIGCGGQGGGEGGSALLLGPLLVWRRRRGPARGGGRCRGGGRSPTARLGRGGW